MQEGVRSALSHSFHYLDDPTGTQICLPECSKKQILFKIPHDEAEIGWCVWIKRQPLELRGFTKFLLYMSTSRTAQHTFCRLQAKLISSGKSVYLFLLIVAVRFFKSSSFLLDHLILNALCDLDFTVALCNCGYVSLHLWFIFFCCDLVCCALSWIFSILF